MLCHIEEGYLGVPVWDRRGNYRGSGDPFVTASILCSMQDMHPPQPARRSPGHHRISRRVVWRRTIGRQFTPEHCACAGAGISGITLARFFMGEGGMAQRVKYTPTPTGTFACRPRPPPGIKLGSGTGDRVPSAMDGGAADGRMAVVMVWLLLSTWLPAIVKFL